jgi:hypothetical protein
MNLAADVWLSLGLARPLIPQISAAMGNGKNKNGTGMHAASENTPQ